MRQARGPLAPLYHSFVSDFHGWDRLMLSAAPASKPSAEEAKGDDAEDKGEPVDKADKADKTNATDKAASDKAAGGKAAGDKPAADRPPTPYDPWLQAAKRDWQTDVDATAEFYKFDQAQKDKANKLLQVSFARLQEVPADYDPDIALYRALVARVAKLSSAPGAGEIPFEKARVAAAQKNPLGETGISGSASPLSSAPPVWQAAALEVERLFHDQLDDLVTPEQRQLGYPATSNSRLRTIDTALGWTLMIVGGLLIAGLLTRLAAVVGALFLLSIICAQPPWLADSLQTFTYNQTVEMLALLVLAGVGAGRWGGLDYFVSRVCCRNCCSKKGTGTAP